MKYNRFLGVSKTTQQQYFKEGIELLYPSQDCPLKIAILPAYDVMDPSSTGWVPAVTGDEESDFYCAVRAAKFVGHGNRRAKTSFLSPRTFDIDADDPYEAFYDYCSRSDTWSYLTKDHRGRKLTGDVEGAVIPRMKTFFVANVIDMSAGPRGGVFVTEMSESVMKSILYSQRKNGSRIDGIAFQKDSEGKLAYGDITDPGNALVIEVAWGGKGYVARPAIDQKGMIVRTELPLTLLQHRQHMEEPATFIQRPESPQEIIDRLAGMLRGYKHPEIGKLDEIEALKEAMKFAYGDKYHVDDESEEKDDPFAEAAKITAEAEPEKKAEAVDEAVERAVENEKYVQVNPVPQQKTKRKKPKPIILDDCETSVTPMTYEPYRDEQAPGEDIDPSDIAAVRAMLSGAPK